jgi:eukaryotic-like serine/threonine-protein kinase
LGGYVHLHKTPSVSVKSTIVLAEVENTAGNREALALEFQKSETLSLLSDDRVQHTLELMLRPKDTRVSAEVAREICERVGGSAVVEESGTGGAVALRARNCQTGDILAVEQAATLGPAAARLTKGLEQALAKMEKPAPLEEATTSSLEALRAYSMAMKINSGAAQAAAVAHLPTRDSAGPAVCRGLRAHGPGLLQHGCHRTRRTAYPQGV